LKEQATLSRFKRATLSSYSHFAFQQRNPTAGSTSSAVVSACLERFGAKIEVLVDVAGVLNTYGNDALMYEKWDRIIATNLTAPVKMMRAVLPEMKKGRE
jgi:NAD(P)-dependent dehydrogenase (short-subunit alcohol dehydrogenase family)